MQRIISNSDILNQCLEQIERGEATVESCIARYPDLDGLEELLHASTAMRHMTASKPRMNPVRKAELEQRMLARYKQMQPVVNTHKRAAIERRQPVWVIRAFAAAFVLILFVFTGTAGIVQAASETVPGDTLYGVKRGVEKIQLQSADYRSRPEVLQNIAHARLKELKVLTDRGSILEQTFLTDVFQSVQVAAVALPDQTTRTVLLNQAQDTFTYVEQHSSVGSDQHMAIVVNVDPGGRPSITMAKYTPTSTLTNTPTDTATATSTSTNTATATYTLTFTATYTETPTNTATVTYTPSPTETDIPTITATPTKKPVFKPTPHSGNNNGGNNGNGNAGNGNSGNSNGGTGNTGGNNGNGNAGNGNSGNSNGGTGNTGGNNGNASGNSGNAGGNGGKKP